MMRRGREATTGGGISASFVGLDSGANTPACSAASQNQGMSRFRDSTRTKRIRRPEIKKDPIGYHPGDGVW